MDSNNLMFRLIVRPYRAPLSRWKPLMTTRRGAAFFLLLSLPSAVAAGTVPSVAYGTYFGGSGGETASAIATDAQGNIFIAGTTTSTDLPGTAGTYQPNKAVGFPG